MNNKCIAHDSTSRHPSCKTSWGLDSYNNANRCVTCNDPNKSIFPAVAASDDGKIPASIYGICKCKDGFKNVD